MPALIAGTAPRWPNDIAHGSYFGGRTPEDGRIDWTWDARRIHDLVRAVAPPYPGAHTLVNGAPARILRTRLLDPDAPAEPPSLVIREWKPHEGARAQRNAELALIAIARCGGGGTLRVDAIEMEGRSVTPAMLHARHGGAALRLG